MNRWRWTLSLALVVGLITAPVLAQQAAPTMQGADQDLKSGMEKMSQGMTRAPMTDDADRDFVAMMKRWQAQHQAR